MGVSLHSKIHPLFNEYSKGTSSWCYAYQYPSLFPNRIVQSLCICIFSFSCIPEFTVHRPVYMYAILLVYLVLVCTCMYTCENNVTAAEISDQDGEDLGLHLKLLSMLDNPAVIVAAAASGDVETLRDFLRKHPSQVHSPDVDSCNHYDITM